MKPRLTKDDIVAAAKELGCDYSALKAIQVVEASGAGFTHDDRPKILFERHKFRARLIALGFAELAAQLEKSHPNLCNKDVGGYATGVDADARCIAEHDRLATASTFNRQAALESCSWGIGQIMGYHWQVLGYPTLQTFINAMYASEAKQLDAMVRYIKSSKPLLSALIAKSWQVVARLYNGKRYKLGHYDTKLDDAEKANR